MLVMYVTMLKKVAIGGLIALLLGLVITIVHIGKVEGAKTDHMKSLCDGEFGYGDIGFGFEALCIINGFPLRWENETWQFTLPLYKVEGG